ncbi:hypothetical protein NA57DRAFT_47155 [Rhizodiscina lignyota]|uniref:DNA-directed DNA polymerase n=1 Tax=Rhizodiscina lignyota TaxID=1504668 RepID=A0A9P4I572_9PEZI|nr:hypothetical protein NA57DRAFT_47155 [Rhizodiscina lignyota]
MVRNDEFDTSERVASSYNPLHTFRLPKGEDRRYQHQFADMYFLRLAQVKPMVEEIAQEAWADFKIAGESPRRVDRVLDVRQGELCWMAGTVYMEMPLKPNVLDDISKEHWIAAPPVREKFLSDDALDQVMLEDESGRLRLTGAYLKTQILVTGCIIAALGTENANGEFEVIDTKVADLPRQPERWERDEASAALSGKKVKQERPKAGKVAFVSGLDISGADDETIGLDLLKSYLLGEVGSVNVATDIDRARVSRLIIAGNSFADSSPIPSRDEVIVRKQSKKYGYDSTTFNPAPSAALDSFLADLLPSLPITLLPGVNDPANVALPQQPLHPALFMRSRNYANPPGVNGNAKGEEEPSWFDSVTNPWDGDVDGWRMLGNGGQPIDDLYRYVEGDERLDMMESVLRWRIGAPTAPDTLWSYPFQDDDPLLIKECPHVFFVGNQPRFESRVIEGPLGQQVRLIAIPRFRESKTIVLLDAETLAVETMAFD